MSCRLAVHEARDRARVAARRRGRTQLRLTAPPTPFSYSATRPSPCRMRILGRRPEVDEQGHTRARVARGGDSDDGRLRVPEHVDRELARASAALGIRDGERHRRTNRRPACAPAGQRATTCVDPWRPRRWRWGTRPRHPCPPRRASGRSRRLARERVVLAVHARDGDRRTTDRGSRRTDELKVAPRGASGGATPTMRVIDGGESAVGGARGDLDRVERVPGTARPPERSTETRVPDLRRR